MKKIIVIGILSMFLLTSFSVFVVAEEPNSNEQITLDYSFGTPVISNVDINGSIYDRIIIEDAPVCGNPGEPRLPGKGVSLLIPQGEKVSSITVIHGEKISLGSGFLVEPVGEPIISSVTNSVPIPTPDEAIYSSEDPFPGKLFAEIGTYSFRGYKILVLKLHPVQYIPANGEIFYYKDLTVSVETVEDENTNPMFRGLEKDKIEVMKKVDNPSTVDTYEYQSMKTQGAGASDESYDMVIITSESLKTGFEPLKQAHDADGCKTLIYTVQDIYNEYSGVDKPEKIWNFIKYAYTTWGIEYVLLGGDDDVVPVRYILNIHNSHPDQVTSDLYYGCLDNRWRIPEENYYPDDRDLSIGPGVSGSSSGDLEGPVVDEEDFRVGSSSMLWTSTVYPDLCTGECILTFDPPLDLSGMHWLNFYMKVEPRVVNLHSFPDITVHSSDGTVLKFHGWDFGPSDTWVLCWYYLLENGGADFNWEEVDSISFWKCARIKDMRLDGIFFNDWYDELWGEPGEDTDLEAEVYVGRACVGTDTEVKNFVNKTIAYMNTDSNDKYLRNVLMAGEYAGFGGNGDWGGNYLDQLIDGCSDYPPTVGIPSDKYTIDKLYDRDWTNNDWPKLEIVKRINNNVHIINGMGHGSPIKVMKLSNLDVDLLLRNNKPFFVYTVACDAGEFDNELVDCFAEHLTVKTSYGAFATIMNAEWGVGFFNTLDSPSQRYHREFWDAVFGENIKEIGRVHQDSKYDNLWRIDEELMRYVYLHLTLFGDPAVSFILNNNIQPNKPVIDGPNSGNPNITYEYIFNAEDLDGDDVKYHIDWDDGNSETTSSKPSGTDVKVKHTWSEQGTYTIKAKAEDIHGLVGPEATLTVLMPRNRAINRPFLRFLENHPLIYQLLQRFLRL